MGKSRHHISLFVILISLFLIACSATEESNLASLNIVYDKDPKTKLYTYIDIMSAVSNEDLHRKYEVSFTQSEAASAFANTKSVDHPDIILDALDHKSPLVRSAALNNVGLQGLTSFQITKKIIDILHHDPVEQLQFDSINTLSNIKAKIACPDFLKIAKNKKQNTEKRTSSLYTFVSIGCPNATSFLISYFKSGEIYTINEEMRNKIISAISVNHSQKFVPYLIEYNNKLEAFDSSVIGALSLIGGVNVEKYIVSLANGKRSAQYKLNIIDELLKFNKPEIDTLVVKKLSKIIKPKDEYTFYSILKNYFENTKRHQKFVNDFINKLKINTLNSGSFKYKTPIAFMLKGVILPEHLKPMKNLIDNEKDNSLKCILLSNLETVESLNHYDFMLSYIDKKYPVNCQYSAIRYLGNTKTKKANNYALSQYKKSTDIYFKISYVGAIGKYPSKRNKAFLINTYEQSKNVTERLEAISGLINQMPDNDWELIESLYLKENDNVFKRIILKSIANYKNPEALETLIAAYKVRRYHTTAGPLLQDRGYTTEQLDALIKY